ncbi:Uncharacterized protein SCG7086_AY_00140 [Chlamydiales bacterium SCGC AG-110-P3]|nr:Uncharacterized protein SCG7086_AY_00140 [Chlamydiales bacterium SCGC AG-110-P3]
MGILVRFPLENVRGVTAEWVKDTAVITFYFEGHLTEDDIDKCSVACTEIIAAFSEGFLEEEYIRLDPPAPLPSSEFWVYKRVE